MSASATNLSWLRRLRWGAIAGQIATIAAVRELYGMQLPLVPLAIVIAIEAATNLALQVRTDADERVATGVMLLDTLLLTALLHFTGGPLNPFSFLYLVQIALAAVVLPARATWALVAFALAGSGSLFVMSARPLGLSHEAYMDLHLRGMWVAFGVAATFITYFLMRVRRDLESREEDLRRAHALTARQQRLASLATLAAGAAHELATPLSTIAVVAGELERRLAHSGEARLIEDVQLVRSQVARCRGILDGMAAEAGETAGESLAAVRVRDVVDEAVARARPAPPVEIEVSGPDTPTRLPRRALTQALQSLLANAQDASPADAPVTLTASRADGRLVVDVVDRGRGMDASMLERVGEPFFTTKAAGRGMGLGLFLTRTLVESLGGTLQLSSQPGQGTRARIALTLHD